MRLTHSGPAKQEVISTINFTKKDVIIALQEFASRHGVQCPPALEYNLIVKTDRFGHSDYNPSEFIILQTRRDGTTNPIYESPKARKSGDEQ